MSDPMNPNIQKRSTPQWALYQRENFWKLNDGETPPFNTGMDYSYAGESIPANRTVLDPEKLEQQAYEKLTEAGWYGGVQCHIGK